MTTSSIRTIAIAGASGFVGAGLAKAIKPDFSLIGLSRFAKRATIPQEDVVQEWRTCDLFSLIEAERGLKGAEVAFYFVHSMMPSARLTQGSFEDFDIIAADNFARACLKNGVKQIVYLGGLIPSTRPLSRHLQSRLEVEEALRSHQVPVTVLRAGIIVGTEGSSFQMLYRLVKRLPVMICPKWTDTPTQPIALTDAIKLLRYVINEPEAFGQTFDIGGNEITSYRKMIVQLSHILGTRCRTFRFPFFTPGLSKLWVRLITQAPSSLVYPLIQSLKHPMVARDLRLNEMAGVTPVPLENALRVAVEQCNSKSKSRPLAFVGARQLRKTPRFVRSVQRLPLPAEKNAKWVGEEYLRWLARLVLPLRVTVIENVCTFRFWPLPVAWLVLEYSVERSTADRSLFYIRGGVLTRGEGRGRMEFRELAGRRFVLSAVLDFRPRLPWLLYTLTQAKAHLFIMKAFGRHLAKVSLQVTGEPQR